MGSARPQLLAERTAAGSYRRRFRVRGEPGELLLQEVVARVEICAGERLLLRYSVRYAEAFTIGARGELIDHHSFDLAHDGWRLEAVLRRLDGRAQGLSRAALELRYEKRFVLGRGALTGATTLRWRRDDGARYGFLERSSAGASAGRLDVHALGGEAEVSTTIVAPYPGGRPASGAARFLAGARFACAEALRYRYATGDQELRCGGYERADEGLADRG